MRRTPISRVSGLLAVVLALSLLTAFDADFVNDVVAFSDPALDANGLNAQGEKCCESVDVPTNEATSEAGADILDVELAPTTQDGVRTGWQVAVTLTGELGEGVRFALDGHSRHCDRIVLDHEPATALDEASTRFATICDDGRTTTTDVEPPTVEGSTFTIAVPDAAMPDIIVDGEALEFIWLEARDQPVGRLIDSADADPDEGFLLRSAPVARPTATPSPPTSESASPEPSEAASPEPSATASPEPSETASPEPSGSASPDDDAEGQDGSGSGPEPDGGPDAATSQVTRVQGADRAATAAAVAEQAHPRSADTVVVASAADYPDALAGAPLAGVHQAPVLLTGPDRLGEDALQQVRRLRPGRALVLGGTAALSEQVVADLEAVGVSRVERVAGQDRFATAAQIARRVELQASVETVYVVEGGDADPSRGWPDAVAVSSSAALLQRPVLLVTTEDVPDATRDFLTEHDVQRAIIVGGEAAVSGGAEQELAGLVVDVQRLVGADRFATSRQVADVVVREGASARATWFATGANWPDALAAGPAAAAQGGVLLLSPNDDSGPARAWIEANGCLDATLVGGDAALSARVEREIRDALAGC